MAVIWDLQLDLVAFFMKQFIFSGTCFKRMVEA